MHVSFCVPPKERQCYLTNHNANTWLSAMGAVLLASLAFTGCTTSSTHTNGSGDGVGVSESAPGYNIPIYTYAGDSTAPFTFIDPIDSWEDLAPEMRESMIQTAVGRGQALIIWGDHVEWTGVYPTEIPTEQKEWVENMVRVYDRTNAPVVFVGGLGTGGLFVETQNVDAPEGERSVEKILYPH